MRKVAVFVLLVFGVVFAFGTAFAAPADKMTLNKGGKMKGAVAYDHKAHAAIEKNCKACHHADEAGKEQNCAKCHGDKTDGKKLSAKEAFHKQCKDCHTKAKKGPAKCD
ncbi:MAG: cytochrome c3 family protein, partial [Thermodesulfobacteriota bacterium]